MFEAVKDSGGMPITGLMPYDGEPQASVSVADGRVAMRIGPVGSGWLNVMRPRSGVSQLVVLDLKPEGELLQGYPLRSSVVSDEAKLEFEGSPLIVGSRMYVGATVRDDGRDDDLSDRDRFSQWSGDISNAVGQCLAAVGHRWTIHAWTDVSHKRW